MKAGHMRPMVKPPPEGSQPSGNTEVLLEGGTLSSWGIQARELGLPCFFPLLRLGELPVPFFLSKGLS